MSYQIVAGHTMVTTTASGPGGTFAAQSTFFGTFAIDVETGILWAQVRNPPDTGPLSWITVTVSGGVTVAMLEARVAVNDVDIYVDKLNGNDANPGTALLPVQTVPAGILLGPLAWKKHNRLHLVDVAATDYPCGASYSINPGYPTGPLAQPFEILGENVVTLMASTAQSAPPAATGIGGQTLLTFATTAGGSDAWAGKTGLITSGVRIGQTFPIATATGTTLTANGLPTGFVQGDNVSVITPSATISVTVRLDIGNRTDTLGLGGDSGAPQATGTTTALALFNVKLSAPYLAVESINLQFDRVEYVTGTQFTCLNAKLRAFTLRSVLVDSGSVAGSISHLAIIPAPFTTLTMEDNSSLLGNYVIRLTQGVFVESDINPTRMDWSSVGFIGPQFTKCRGTIFAARLDGFISACVFGEGSSFTVNLVSITNTVNPIQCLSNSYIRAVSVIGSTGNTGSGMTVALGGVIANESGNTLTGTSGDVQIDGRIGITYALAGARIQSTFGQSGTQVNFAGGLTAGAGATTGFLPTGGLPGVVSGTHFSTTAIRTPITPGRTFQRLRMVVLTNTMPATTTVTLQKAPLATGTPAATALTFTVATTVTGSFSDTSQAHNVAYNDGDQIDLALTETGVGTLTCTAAVQGA